MIFSSYEEYMNYYYMPEEEIEESEQKEMDELWWKVIEEEDLKRIEYREFLKKQEELKNEQSKS